MKREKFTNLADAAECAIKFSREGHLFAMITKIDGTYVVENFSSSLSGDEELIGFYENGDLMGQNNQL